MSPYLGKYKQNIAIEMRKKGFSYSDIGNRMNIPKSTLSYWLKNIELTPEQIKKLNERKIRTAKLNSLKRVKKILKTIKEIEDSSQKNIKNISKRELWLMGIILYWKNGNITDFKKGIYFSNSNPFMIKLFLKWLKEVGNLKDEEIKFDIFIKINNKNNLNNLFKEKVINFWSKITGAPKNQFSKIYCQKGNYKKANYGFLRVKVVQSSLLARQVNSWIEGIKQQLID